MLIAYSGRKQAGKDTLAAFMRQEFEKQGKKVVLLPFAKGVKDFATKYFNWDGEKSEAEIKTPWGEFIGGRRLLQGIGLMMREEVSPAFWIDRWILAYQGALNDGYDVVQVTDCRFLNEAAAVKMMGGTLIYVHRPGRLRDDHPSETEMNSKPFQRVVDFSISNIFELHDLNNCAREAVERLTNGV